MSIISLKDITFSYETSTKPVLENFSMNVEKGEYIALTGKNGSGKSTVSRLITGLETPQSGSITIEKDISIGLVFQNPKNQIISGMVSRDTAFGPKTLKCSKSETELRTIESLNVTGMLFKASSSTMALSLGQTQKVALSGIIAMNVDVLILDEALSMLDDESKKDIYSFLDYFHSQGKTIIHITHEKNAVEKADRVIHIGDKTENITLPPRSPTDTAANETALVFDHVSFSYPQCKVFEDLSFSLKKGKLYALTGASGTGKSTALELIAGLLKPDSGNIYADGTISLCQQNAQAALFENFAADDVAFGPRNQGLKGKALKLRVKEAMDKAGIPFDEFSDRSSFYLSGGEQRRLAIAGILALDTDIILFDEPTCGLDSEHAALVIKLLRELTDSGKTVLFSTHHDEEKEFADSCISINGENNYTTPDTLPPQIAVPSTRDMIESLNKLSATFNARKMDKKSFLINLPSAVKILIFLALFVLSLCPSTVPFAFSMFCLSLIYTAFAKCPIHKLLKTYLKITPFLLLFALFQIMFRRPVEGEVLYTTARFFTVSPSKLLFCLTTYLKTLASLSFITGFFLSTPEYDLIDGLEILLKPLSLLKIPVQYFTLIMEIIFRFIPLLIDEACSIIKTQTIRGGLGSEKGFFAKVRALIPLFVPLIAQTIKRSEALSEALTIRGVK